MARSEASAGMAGVGSQRVDGGDGENMAQKRGTHWEGTGGKKTGRVMWQWGQAQL